MKQEQTQSHCLRRSWCHYLWFRILMMLVALDIVFMAAALVLGYDIFSVLVEAEFWVRIIVAAVYTVTALFILFHTISYNRLMKECDFVCHKCAGQK